MTSEEHMIIGGRWGRLRTLVFVDRPVMSHRELSVSKCSGFNKSLVRLPEMGPGCLIIKAKTIESNYESQADVQRGDTVEKIRALWASDS